MFVDRYVPKTEDNLIDFSLCIINSATFDKTKSLQLKIIIQTPVEATRSTGRSY